MIKKRVYEGEHGYNEIQADPIVEFGTGKLYKLMALQKGLADYDKSARLTNLVHKVIPKICGTCRFWNFKSSDKDKCYGQCRNEKARQAIYFYIDWPYTEDKKLRDSVEPRFEENSFGCIYWERQ